MLSFRETRLWSMGLIQLYTWMTWIAHSITGDLSSSGFSDLSHIRCHTGAYFRFRWDLRIFTEVTCAMINDFMTFVLWTCRAPDAILGHIFHFRCDLWIFAYVACSMIDDFMSPDFWPIIRSMPYWCIFFSFRYGDDHSPTDLLQFLLLVQEILHSLHGHYSYFVRRDELLAEHDVRVLIAPLARTI